MLLGAGVRAMNAGLTCPDWPLCFGAAIPKYHFGVYLEFIHRAIAGVLFLIYFFSFIAVIKNKKSDKNLKKYFLIGLFFLIAQVIMGGLTVLALLKSGIVTAHLSLGACFLISLVTIQNHISMDSKIKYEVDDLGKFLTLSSLCFFAFQFLLGGFVASTYSGTACLDFPLCNGQWVPTLTGPLGLQVLHRFSAYALALVGTLQFFYFVFKSHADQKVKNSAVKVFLLILTQVMVGILNIKMIIPAWLTVIHLGVALLILLALCRLSQQVFSSKLK